MGEKKTNENEFCEVEIRKNRFRIKLVIIFI